MSLARLDEPQTALEGLTGTVVIDEVQRNHRGVGASETHGLRPATERLAASIFASCGTKSQ